MAVRHSRPVGRGVPVEATYVTIQFDYDFLVQTTPTSTEFAKQTASDTLTIAIAAQTGG